MYEGPGSMPSTAKMGGVVHAYKPSPWTIKGGRPKIQGHPQLNSWFGASLGYVRRCVEEQQQNHKCILSPSWKPEVWNQVVSRARLPLEALRKAPSLVLPASVGTIIP